MLIPEAIDCQIKAQCQDTFLQVVGQVCHGVLQNGMWHCYCTWLLLYIDVKTPLLKTPCTLVTEHREIKLILTNWYLLIDSVLVVSWNTERCYACCQGKEAINIFTQIWTQFTAIVISGERYTYGCNSVKSVMGVTTSFQVGFKIHTIGGKTCLILQI